MIAYGRAIIDIQLRSNWDHGVHPSPLIVHLTRASLSPLLPQRFQKSLCFVVGSRLYSGRLRGRLTSPVTIYSVVGAVCQGHAPSGSTMQLEETMEPLLIAETPAGLASQFRPHLIPGSFFLLLTTSKPSTQHSPPPPNPP